MVPVGKGRLRHTALALTLAGLPLLAGGCLVVPIPTNRLGPYSRNEIKPEVINELVVGQISREEVLLRLGEPDEASAGGARYRYHWEIVKWDIIWIVAGPYTAESGDIPVNQNHNLLISFSPADVISERTLSARYEESELEKQLRLSR